MQCCYTDNVMTVVPYKNCKLSAFLSLGEILAGDEFEKKVDFNRNFEIAFCYSKCYGVE